MNKSLALVLRNVMYNLRGGFLVRPLGIAVALGAVGAVLSWAEEIFPGSSSILPTLLFPSRSDPQVAQAILGGIASSIMTVVSIVFAILLMTLTLASMQFSPRIIVSFAQDRVTQWTLGIFLGTFCYCMAALPAAREKPVPFSPVLTVAGAMILALACVGWLLFFIHHISHAVSVNYIIDRIAAETEAVIDELMPQPRKALASGSSLAPPTAAPTSSQATVASVKSGYIRVADAGRLLERAKTHRVRVKVCRRVGHFVPAGAPLMTVSPADRLRPDVAADLLSVFDIGPSRTLQQDVEFGVLQIVDIALRAISPAVNDPSTCINCIDQLSRILIHFAGRQMPTSVYYDLPGVVRVEIAWIDFDGLLESAFEQIRHYGSTDLAVCLRLLRALTDIAGASTDPTQRSTILRRGLLVAETIGRELPEEDLAGLHARLESLKLTAISEAESK